MNEKVLGVILVWVIFVVVGFVYFVFPTNVCGDGTDFDSCSKDKPYFCDEGALVRNAEVCGCPEGFTKYYSVCTSKYQTGPKKVYLNYVLDGEVQKIGFVVYEGVKNYTQTIPRFISYYDGSVPLRQDFKLKNINEPVQREFLLPLVKEIQDLTWSKKEQARIAISLVQNIPYGELNETILVGSQNLNSSRYAYEVVYDMHGICGEKSELLAFLLKEIGYGVSIFYYGEENHEAVGLKCSSLRDYKDTSYCFIETTGISNGEVKALSTPEVIPISDGDSFGFASL